MSWSELEFGIPTYVYGFLSECFHFVVLQKKKNYNTLLLLNQQIAEWEHKFTKEQKWEIQKFSFCDRSNDHIVTKGIMSFDFLFNSVIFHWQ